MHVRSDEIDLFYETVGDGPPAVFLHPFPVNHEFWRPVTEALATRYRIVTPDLRGLGQSGVGEGAATMGKHAEDVRRLADELRIGRFTLVGCSIGGYIAFEFWRRYRERVNALVLSNTKASADTAEARAARLQTAEQVLERGTEQAVDAAIPKLIGETTRRNRPDIVDEARKMMMKTTKEGFASVQRGMAERQDSVPTLGTISAPTMVIAGEEDQMSTVAEMQSMQRAIPGSEMRVIGRAGHFAAFERAAEFTEIVRDFFGRIQHRL